MQSWNHSIMWFLLVAIIFGDIQTASFASSTKFKKCFTGSSLPRNTRKIHGSFRVADSGFKRVLTYGPYISLQPGNYVAEIASSIPGTSKSVLAVIGWATQGRQIVGCTTALLTKIFDLGKFTTSLELRKLLAEVEVRVVDMEWCRFRFKTCAFGKFLRHSDKIGVPGSGDIRK